MCATTLREGVCVCVCVCVTTHEIDRHLPVHKLIFGSCLNYAIFHTKKFFSFAVINSRYTNMVLKCRQQIRFFLFNC